MASLKPDLTKSQRVEVSKKRKWVQTISQDLLEEKQKILFSQENKGLSLSLKASWLQTPLGLMVAVADEEFLYLLEFEKRKGLQKEVRKLQEKASILLGTTKVLLSITEELEQYFQGRLKKFETPIAYFGTSFQKLVWKELQKIPFGETRSYSDIAVAIKNPKGVRAVARANATNRLAIIIPCHRVILADGRLGGYGGGVDCKKKLLDLEINGQ